MAREVSGWAVGWTIFAAVMMIMNGAFNVIAGLVALFQEEFYLVGREYIFEFNVTAWGWIHLILGVVMLLAGFALFRAASWARVVGVVLAVVSGIAAFAWIPQDPFWGALMIASSFFVIWALTAHGEDVTTLKTYG
jgi:hypothetical protein